MKVEVEIPDPPEGWVYDGHRTASTDEMIFNGREWMLWKADSPSKWQSFVAVKKPEPWQPPKEVVDAILLLFGDGWIFPDGGSFWTAVKPQPYFEESDHVPSGFNSESVRYRIPMFWIPDNIPWKETLIKIGDPQQ